MDPLGDESPERLGNGVERVGCRASAMNGKNTPKATVRTPYERR